MMEYRPIDVKLLCAKDLKNVNVFSKMDVYVMGSISSDPNNIQRTPVHKDGGANPSWNHTMKFVVDESAARLNWLGLMFRIMSDRTLGDREIGRVYVPLKELFTAVVKGDNSGEISNEEKLVTYRVQTPSGKYKGSLEFSYKIGERFAQPCHDRKLNEPVITYPAWSGPEASKYTGPSQVATYPPQGYGYGYGYPSQLSGPSPNANVGYGYVYPGQAVGGYGYPGQGHVPVAPPKRGGRFGMGSAAMGIGAGLLGGFLLGEAIEDVAEVAAYDDMMDDGMFDF